MKTNDDEATQYTNPSHTNPSHNNPSQCQDDESTTLNITGAPVSDDEATSLPDSTATPPRAKKGKAWKQYAASAGTGILIGAVVPTLMGMKSADDTDPDKPEEDNPENGREQLSHPEWVDNEVSVATSVNDDMSFGQAFATARAEVGSGGVFEWRGNIYTTHTAEEWAAMTPQERAEYSDHFSWNHIDHSSSNVAQHSSEVNQLPHTEDTAQIEDESDDIEIISVDNPGRQDVTQNLNVDPATDDEVQVTVQEPEIEILGVVHDAESNVNVAGMNIDGQEVILIDVDNDMTFDYMASDANGNGQIDTDELVDIEAQNLTVADLGGFNNPTGDLYAENNGPDYSADGVYEG